jgi:hypothetical protein
MLARSAAQAERALPVGRLRSTCLALTNDRRSSFQAAIAATHQTGHLTPPATRWDMLDEAVVTIECEAHEPSVAAETVRSIIRRNAELVAHIGVREIEIISISPVS